MNVKRLRRFLSVLLSMSMVLSLNTASFAAEVGDAAADAQVHTEAEPEEIPETEAADPQAELNEASLEEAPQEETQAQEIPDSRGTDNRPAGRGPVSACGSGVWKDEL